MFKSAIVFSYTQSYTKCQRTPPLCLTVSDKYTKVPNKQLYHITLHNISASKASQHNSLELSPANLITAI